MDWQHKGTTVEGYHLVLASDATGIQGLLGVILVSLSALVTMTPRGLPHA